MEKDRKHDEEDLLADEDNQSTNEDDQSADEDNQSTNEDDQSADEDNQHTDKGKQSTNQGQDYNTTTRSFHHDESSYDQNNSEMHASKIAYLHISSPSADPTSIKNCIKIKPSNCPHHYVPLSLYCNDCKRSYCPLCVISENQQQQPKETHTLQPIAAIAQKVKEEIEQNITANERIIKCLEEENRSLENSLKNISESENLVRKDIRVKFDQIRNKCDELQKQFEQELTTKCKESRKNVNIKIEESNKTIKKVRELLKEAKDAAGLEDITIIDKGDSMSKKSKENEIEKQSHLKKPKLVDTVTFPCDIQEILKYLQSPKDPSMKLDMVVKTTLNLPPNAQWSKIGITVAGGNQFGSRPNQLWSPSGFFVDEDDDKTIVIADTHNNRIVEYKQGKSTGTIVVDGNVSEDNSKALKEPTGVIIDKVTDSFIITDRGNDRVLRWPRIGQKKKGEPIIENIRCLGIAMDKQRNLFVYDEKTNKIRKCAIDKDNKKVDVDTKTYKDGKNDRQSKQTKYLFIDQNESLYVSNSENQCLVKWDLRENQNTEFEENDGAGQRISLTRLHKPNGIFVDSSGAFYVVENEKDCVMCFRSEASTGILIVGGNGRGAAKNQLNRPTAISFDKLGNLYVLDTGNDRVQRFDLIK